MAVRKIKNSWWVDFRFNGKRYRKRSPDNSRAGALVYETTLRKNIANGKSIDKADKERTQTKLFHAFADEWFDLYVKNNNKPSEITTKRYILNSSIIPFFGNTPLNQITTLMIEKYKTKKKISGLSNQSINNHLNILGKCLRTAQEWQELNSVPQLKRLKVPPYKFDFLDINESEILLNNARGINHEMILTALKTGLRLGELRALKWSDFNWRNKTVLVQRSFIRGIVVPPKNNKTRIIPLTDQVINNLNARKRNKGYIFAGKSGKLFSENKLYRDLHKACADSGLRKIGWHTLRHTFASHLAMAGASMRAIMELLGHSNVKTTLRYAHLAPSTLRATVNLLENENRYFGQPAVNQPVLPARQRIALISH